MNCSNGHINPPRYPVQKGKTIGLCKLCNAISRKKYYAGHRDKCKKIQQRYHEKHAERLKAIKRERTRKLRLKVLTHYCNGTIRCTNSDCKVTEPALLELDHINGNGNAHRRKVGESADLYKWLIDNQFPPIIQVMCANCHKAKHAGVSWL